MERLVHEFDNGIRVYDDHLMPAQRERYRVRNVHEADEEELFIRVIRSLPADGCYINIGTAIGYYAILARKLSPRLVVHAVEPLTTFQQYFRENIGLNDLNESDFVLHRYAVGSENGRVSFVEKGYESQLLVEDRNLLQKLARLAKNLARQLLANLGIKKYAAGGGRLSETESITLDVLIEKAGGNADLVSMDVQGLESAILAGGMSVLAGNAISTFLIGTHSDALHRECIHILRDHGYEIEYEEAHTKNQPDGIIIASRGVRRLTGQEGNAA